MSEPLRVLYVEDLESDAALTIRLLEKGGYIVAWERVETATEMRNALFRQAWDVVICDYRLPRLDAPSALGVLKDTNLDIPFIVVSGTVGEDVAVEMMRCGAHDYVMKDNLARLVQAVAREVRDAETREERKKAEAALLESSLLNQQIIASAQEGIIVCDRKLKYRVWNRFMEQLTGHPASEIIGRHPDVAFPWLREVGVQQTLEEALAGVTSRSVEFRFQDEVTGKSAWCSQISGPLRDASGEIVGVLAIVLDITARKAAERALWESEQRFRQVVEGAPDGIFIQLEGVFQYLNPTAIAMFGAENAGQLTGRPFLDRVHPQMRAEVSARVQRLSVDREFVPLLEEQYLRLDGTPFDVEVTAAPFTVDRREGGIVFFRDIAARKKAEEERSRLEEQFRQAQKLESVGRLAGGLAHDFNNLLTVVNGYSELALEGLDRQHPLWAPLSAIREAGDRGASLTRQLLVFSRKHVIDTKPLNVNECILEIRDTLQRLLGEDIELLTELAPSLGYVMADRSQFHQVLMNLAVNARDAMPGGGRLTVETSNLEVNGSSAPAHGELPLGNYVLLSVSDTGVGMDEETKRRAFEPFFTTKSETTGTGLGLSTVYGIVRQSHGGVWVESEPDCGATFKVCLPLIDVPLPKTEVETFGRRPSGGSETILVVEDQREVRDLVLEVLRLYGYKALQASTGSDALVLAQHHPGPIHLVLTDIVMPRMTGPELVKRVASLRKTTRVLYMSGHPSNLLVLQEAMGAGAHYISKPFRPDELARKVREILD